MSVPKPPPTCMDPSCNQIWSACGFYIGKPDLIAAEINMITDLILCLLITESRKNYKTTDNKIVR